MPLSAWQTHLAAHRAKNPRLNLKTCMQQASKTYRSSKFPPEKVEVDEAKYIRLKEERYNEGIYDYVNSLDIGAILRWNVLNSIKDELLNGRANPPSRIGVPEWVSTDVGMLMMRKEKTGEIEVSMPAIHTPPMVLPKEIQKGMNARALSTPQQFLPTIVRLTEESALNPKKIKVPNNLDSKYAQKLKSHSF